MEGRVGIGCSVFRPPAATLSVRPLHTYGASPRASQNLVIGAKAAAILDGRSEVRREDVVEVAHAVLGHRIIRNFAAEAEGVGPQQIVEELLKAVA